MEDLYKLAQENSVTIEMLRKRWLKKLLFGVGTIVFLAIFGELFIGGRILISFGTCTKGVITNDTITNAPDSRSRYPEDHHLKRWPKPDLLYKFSVNGKILEGVAFETDTAKIGDTVCVLYLKALPNINRPMKYFEYDDVKCDCK